MSFAYRPTDEQPRVIHADHEVLVVDKPAGLLSVPGRGEDRADCLIERLRGAFPTVLLVQSNGGVCGLRRAAEQPARLLLSGPSGGALAAERLAQLLDRPDLVAVDMGGTSYDVSVVLGGRLSIVTQGEVDRLLHREVAVRERTRAKFAIGESVKVISGPLSDFSGEISEINEDGAKLKVLVSIFGRETPVEVGFDQVKKV